MKKILLCILAILIISTSSVKDINDITIIKCIGIEMNNNGITVTFNKLIPEKGDNISSYSIESIKVNGTNLYKIIDDFYNNYYEIVDLDHIELLIIDNYFYDHFNDVVDCINNLNIRNNFLITIINNNSSLISDNNLSEVIKKKLSKKPTYYKDVINKYLDNNYLYIPKLEAGDIYE